MAGTPDRALARGAEEEAGMSVQFLSSVIFITFLAALALAALDRWRRDREYHKRMNEDIVRELQRKEDRAT